MTAGLAQAQEPVKACLITKTDINPFFVKMKEGATAKADELGMQLMSFAGKVDGDNETQVAAIETCIADGASGILITASSTSAIVPVVEQAPGVVQDPQQLGTVVVSVGSRLRQQEGVAGARCVRSPGGAGCIRRPQ